MLVELVKEFADEAHLPFDAAGCLAQMRDTVADIRTHCGDDFDFAPVERALEELDKACAGRICFSSDRQAKEAGGRLTRLLCSACDEYHFCSGPAARSAAGQGQAPQRPATSGIFVLADSLPPAGEPLCI